MPLCRSYRANFQTDFETTANGAEELCKLLKAERRVDWIAKNETRRCWLIAEKQCRRFIQPRTRRQ